MFCSFLDFAISLKHPISLVSFQVKMLMDPSTLLLATSVGSGFQGKHFVSSLVRCLAN